jgi:hypothetical protein
MLFIFWDGREGEVRTMATLVLTVLSAVLTMSIVLVVVGGLATILVYSLTDSLETGLAVGLLAGLLGWLDVSLIPDFLGTVKTTLRRVGSGFWITEQASVRSLIGVLRSRNTVSTSQRP